MKKIPQIIITMAFCFLGFVGHADAQYIEKLEGKVAENAPLREFAEQQQTLFNFGWKFQLGNPDKAERADFDDSGWRTLDVPHDFQFEQPWNEKEDMGRGFKPMCEGWYRKTFNIPEALKGKRIVLDFEGVMYVCDVYVNG
jgi:beta-galactosidase